MNPDYDAFEYYDQTRTHRALDKDAPIPRAVEAPALGRIVEARSVDSTIDTNDARPDLSLDLVKRSSVQIGVGLGTRVTIDDPDGRATP
jgi:hypothetical protein